MPIKNRAPREMPEGTYQWLCRNFAFFAGLQHLERHWGGMATTRRWVLDHGYGESSAEAEAIEVFGHWHDHNSRLLGMG